MESISVNESWALFMFQRILINLFYRSTWKLINCPVSVKPPWPVCIICIFCWGHWCSNILTWASTWWWIDNFETLNAKSLRTPRWVKFDTLTSKFISLPGSRLWWYTRAQSNWSLNASAQRRRLRVRSSGRVSGACPVKSGWKNFLIDFFWGQSASE